MLFLLFGFWFCSCFLLCFLITFPLGVFFDSVVLVEVKVGIVVGSFFGFVLNEFICCFELMVAFGVPLEVAFCDVLWHFICKVLQHCATVMW